MAPLRRGPLPLRAALAATLLALVTTMLPAVTGSAGAGAAAAGRHPATFTIRFEKGQVIQPDTGQRVRAKVRVRDRRTGRAARGKVWFVDRHGHRTSRRFRLGRRGWASITKDPRAGRREGTHVWRIRYGGSRRVRPRTSKRRLRFEVRDTTLDHRLAVAPDFLNLDVGDVREQSGWDPGDPNSWSPTIDRNVDLVLDRIAGHDPEALLIPGDLVEGRWGHPDNDTGIFGSVATSADRVEMARAQAAFYQGLQAHRFRRHGLTAHPAVGDHDIGDNPWRYADPATKENGPWWDWKRRHLGLWRDAFAAVHLRRADGSWKHARRPHGTEWSRTAYATMLNRHTLLVTLDTFDRRADTVVPQVTGGQLRWLRRVLRQAREDGVRWIFVQGHVPVLRPVRQRHSSGLLHRGGRRSDLWQVMKRFGVDLYLTGEVHDSTRISRDGITQISTGGLIQHGESTYLTIDIYSGRLQLRIHEWDVPRMADPNPPLWQGGDRLQADNRDYRGFQPSVTGRLTVRVDHTTTTGRGKLAPYRP